MGVDELGTAESNAGDTLSAQKISVIISTTHFNFLSWDAKRERRRLNAELEGQKLLAALILIHSETYLTQTPHFTGPKEYAEV